MVKKDIANKTVVIVREWSNSYKGKYKGYKGIVSRNSNEVCTIPVELVNTYNPRSSTGVFWFKPEELNIVEDAVMVEDVMTFFKVARTKKVGNKNQIEEENNEMRTENIINLWDARELMAINTDHEAMVQEVINGDKLVKFINGKIEDINREIKKVNQTDQIMAIPVSHYIGEETEKAILKYNEMKKKALQKHGKIREEVKALVSACETYEQELNVLKAYLIVDERGMFVDQEW